MALRWCYHVDDPNFIRRHTRLTESGLSITEWKPLTGTLPPLNTSQWMEEFDKYKNTDQFRFIHADFSLSDFKSIFLW